MRFKVAQRNAIARCDGQSHEQKGRKVLYLQQLCIVTWFQPRTAFRQLAGLLVYWQHASLFLVGHPLIPCWHLYAERYMPYP
jgi:hypothetical protein